MKRFKVRAQRKGSRLGLVPDAINGQVVVLAFSLVLGLHIEEVGVQRYWVGEGDVARFIPAVYAIYRVTVIARVPRVVGGAPTALVGGRGRGRRRRRRRGRGRGRRGAWAYRASCRCLDGIQRRRRGDIGGV